MTDIRLWQKRVRTTCAGVLLLALVLRLGGSSPVGASQELGFEAASFLLYLQTGRTARLTPNPEAALPAAITEPYVFPTEAPEKEDLTFSPEEAQNIEIKYGGEYSPDIGALLAAPVDLDFSGEAPRILIIHTHATESYTQEPGWEYAASANYRTLDTQYNMIRVGEAMAQTLEAAGISVLHDTGLNDYPSYNGSYDRTLQSIESYLATYPSIEMVIDVHRDAVELSDGTQMGTDAIVNGKHAAQVMLVMGSDEGGLYHPNWEKNLSWALKLQVQMDALYPGLSRPLSLRPERYNEHATEGSLLVEIGTAGDTLQEAITAGEAFAQVLISTIEGLGLK